MKDYDAIRNMPTTELKYTQEQLDTMAALQEIGYAITNMDVPRDVKKQKKLAEARKYAARHLHDLGYSHRQIAEVLGLASPQSISVYLNLDNGTKGNDLADERSGDEEDVQ